MALQELGHVLVSTEMYCKSLIMNALQQSSLLYEETHIFWANFDMSAGLWIYYL